MQGSSLGLVTELREAEGQRLDEEEWQRAIKLSGRRGAQRVES